MHKKMVYLNQSNNYETFAAVKNVSEETEIRTAQV